MMQDENQTRKQLPLNAGEEILHIERMAELRSAINMVIGRMVITNQRIVFFQKRINMFGLIGVLLGMGKLVLTLNEPLSAVKGMKQGQHGPNKKVMELDLGKEKPMRFVLNRKYEEAAPDLKKLIGI